MAAAIPWEAAIPWVMAITCAASIPWAAVGGGDPIGGNPMGDDDLVGGGAHGRRRDHRLQRPHGPQRLLWRIGEVIVGLGFNRSRALGGAAPGSTAAEIEPNPARIVWVKGLRTRPRWGRQM